MAKIGINIKEGTLKKKVIVGIDLGTTNSLIAFINEEKQPYVLSNSKELLVPSIIHIDKSGKITVGNAANEYLSNDPQNTIYSIKRFLGKNYEDIKSVSDNFNYQIVDDGSDNLVKIKIHDTYYSPIELSSFILIELRQIAEKKLNCSITDAVITVPAYFNDSQRQATRDAGKLAGLNVLRIINEPTAASLAYGLNLNNVAKTIAVYDLGGGTFDISLLRIEDGIFEVLSTHGNTNLGGDDFDTAIVRHWIENNSILKKQFEAGSLKQDALRELAKEAKEYLSANTEFSHKTEEVNLTLSLEQFNLLINSKVTETIMSCKKAIKDASVSLNEIDEVVLVGGSTRVPLVAETVAELFNHSSINKKNNPDEVVALGAAIEAEILSGNRKDMVLLDVTPLSLGIEMVGGLMDVIVPRNSTIPTKVAKEYTTSVDGQVNLKVTIFQGERELVKDNRELASFTLKGIPAMPAGFPKIKISFLVNADGILKVTALEERSNTVTEVEIEPSYGLTDSQVEQMLIASIENAKDDFSERQNAEVITEAEQHIYITKRFIENNGNVLSDIEISETNFLVENLNKLLQKNENRDTISTAIEALNNYTKPFAERAMDTAVKNALHGKKI